MEIIKNFFERKPIIFILTIIQIIFIIILIFIFSSSTKPKKSELVSKQAKNYSIHGLKHTKYKNKKNSNNKTNNNEVQSNNFTQTLKDLTFNKLSQENPTYTPNDLKIKIRPGSASSMELIDGYSSLESYIVEIPKLKKEYRYYYQKLKPNDTNAPFSYLACLKTNEKKYKKTPCQNNIPELQYRLSSILDGISIKNATFSFNNNPKNDTIYIDVLIYNENVDPNSIDKTKYIKLIQDYIYKMGFDPNIYQYKFIED